ncbi:MAG: uracil-DNA glycosylase [Bacteroidetes bacterium]|nr:uracil-DNA glycosylase [Bacteroidota bacterium]
MSALVHIHDTWKQALQEEFGKPYYRQLLNKIEEQKIAGKHVYPPDDLVFNAFNLTHFDELKVVIIGQDPYHGAGQAHGLSFSVPYGIKPPPSLVNIYKELRTDIGMPIPNHGNLEKWAKQGVLLLNAALSVNEGEPNSHADFGWYTFTDAVVKTISDKKEGIVFILWGKFAQNKAALIDGNKHHILTSAHPSPFSATKFFGNRHFSKTNELLTKQGKQPIDWTL